MKTQWRPPALWEDFEDLCYRLALTKGALTSLHKYGRRGQEQFGVDIAGTSPSSRTEWTGFQCKLKTECLGGRLNEQEFLREYTKSKAFEPRLTHWILATTSSRDTSIQDVVNQINASFQRAHTVEAWFWEDIEDLLDAYPKVASRFYQHAHADLTEFEASTLYVHLFASDPDTTRRQKLDAFFRNAFFRSRMRAAEAIVSTAILEVVDNCLQGSKGGATRISIEFDGIQVRLLDNGKVFDPFDEHLQLGDNQFGVRSVRALLAPSSPVVAKYEARDINEGVTCNCLSLSLRDVPGDANMDNCTAYADVMVLFSRRDAFEVFNNLLIPPHCDPYILRLTGDSPASASGTHQLILQLKQRLGRRKLRIIVGAHRRHIFEALVGNSLFREQFEIVQE